MPQDSFYGMPVPGPKITDLPDVDAINPSNGDTLVYNSTTKKWEHGTGSWVSSIYSKWDVNAPPASAGALDDEFQDSSLSVNWTESDPDGRCTETEDSWGLRFDYTAKAAPQYIAGLYKTIPGGDWTIITRGSVGNIHNTQTLTVGICLWEDATNAAKKACGFAINHANTTSNIEVTTWTSLACAGGSSKASVAVYKDCFWAYFRVRYVAGTTTYYFDFSWDGMSWYQLYTATIATIGFTPTHFGLFGNSSVNGIAKRMFFNFFRYLASDVGLLAPLNGRLMSVGQGGLALVPTVPNPGQAMFAFDAGVTIIAGKLRIYNATGVSKTITKVTASANTAPTGANMILDVHKNGVTIFTNQAHRPTILDGANMGYTNVIDLPGFSDGDYITGHIDQIGSTQPGADVSIIVGYV